MFNVLLTLEEISKTAYEIEDLDIEAIALGKQNALHDFYIKAHKSIYGFALSITKNKFDAEDVLQETVLAVYNNAGNYKSHGKPMAWVLTIAKNFALAKFRDEKKQASFSESIGYKDIDFSEIDNIQQRLLIEGAFTALQDDERSIITLKTVSGLNFREIAELLESPLGSVLSKYHRALKKLKKYLEGSI
jgi:RNA polymerase sigma-70 factor (ECF subfamily)